MHVHSTHSGASLGASRGLAHGRGARTCTFLPILWNSTMKATHRCSTLAGRVSADCEQMQHAFLPIEQKRARGSTEGECVGGKAIREEEREGKKGRERGEEREREGGREGEKEGKRGRERGEERGEREGERGRKREREEERGREGRRANLQSREAPLVEPHPVHLHLDELVLWQVRERCAEALAKVSLCTMHADQTTLIEGEIADIFTSISVPP